jgi:hypothetical protein
LQPADRDPRVESKPSGQPQRQAAQTPKPSSKRLHRKQTAAYLGVSLSWLDKSRLTGLGPVFITIGGRIVYDSADLDAFLQSNRRTSTSEQY